MLSANTFKTTTACIIIALSVIFLDAVKSDAQVLADLQNSFSASQKNNLQEKIYVHTNKSAYLTGELLWFKVYNTDNSTKKLLELSKVCYAELLDDNNNAVLQAKIALHSGMGYGSLYVPFSLNTGNYRLVVYTNWMKNFGMECFFDSKVAIVNPLKTTPAPSKPAAYDFQFFPEGGHLVKNVKSRLAFKLTGYDGRGVACTGAIVNQKNDTIIRFKSLKFGIGSFVFTPSANETYKAVIRTNNTSMVKEIPEVVAAGFVMQALNAGNSWQVDVKNSDSTSNAAVYVIAHNKQAIQFAAEAKLANGKANFTIDKSKLADGLSYITLFDDQKRPLCERLIFKRPAKKLVIDAAADNQVYSTRKKVEVAIATKGQDKQFTNANLSVSVFLNDAFQTRANAHISGYLWLESDLKGNIESPDYYLESSDGATDAALDNLMLSQGWTQFDWNKALTGTSAQFHFIPEYVGPIITGHISNRSNNVPAKDITAYLTIPGKPDQFYTAKSDSSGQVVFSPSNFYGTKEITVQTDYLRDSTYRIELARPFSEQHTVMPAYTFAITSDMKSVFTDNSINMQVQNIFAADQLKQFYPPGDDSLAFYGHPTKSYKLDDYTRFTTMEEVLREYVGSIAVSKRQGKFSIKTYNVDKPLGNPLILLDGAPVFDADKIFKVDPLKIKRLDVVAANYRYGPSFFNGIMSFTTYKGSGASIEIDTHALVLDYEGLQLERRFYSPVYDSDVLLNSPVPDFRTSLYWGPKLNTGKSGKTSLKFYTSDKPGNYIGIVEGITSNGETGTGQFFFEVKK